MRRMMVLGVWVAVAMLASACGDDDDSQASPDPEAAAGREAYADAIGETLTFLGLSEDDGACLAGVYIDVIGLEHLQDVATPDEIRETADLTTLGGDLSEADGEAFYAAANDCVDVRQLLLGLVSGGDDTARTCLDQAISDDVLEQAFVGGLLLGDQALDPEVESAITSAYDQCAAQLAPG